MDIIDQVRDGYGEEEARGPAAGHSNGRGRARLVEVRLDFGGGARRGRPPRSWASNGVRGLHGRRRDGGQGLCSASARRAWGARGESFEMDILESMPRAVRSLWPRRLPRRAGGSVVERDRRLTAEDGGVARSHPAAYFSYRSGQAPTRCAMEMVNREAQGVRRALQRGLEQAPPALPWSARAVPAQS